MERYLSENLYLVVYMQGNREPMKMIDDRGNVIIFSCVSNQASCRVLNIL